MSRRTRMLAATLVLVLGLPAYVVAAATLVSFFDRPPVLLEAVVYLGLGVLWALPLRRLFLGLGRPDRDRERDDR